MDSITELFLPTSLPSWLRIFVVVMFVLQAVGVLVYAVFLCRECARPKDQYTYEKVKLENKGI
jgi:hypothetical protein